MILILLSCESPMNELKKENSDLKNQNKELKILSSQLDSTLNQLEEKQIELDRTFNEKLSKLESLNKQLNRSSSSTSNTYGDDDYNFDSRSYKSDYYRKEVCSGYVERRGWNKSGSRLTLEVKTICPYCSKTEYRNIYIDKSRCKDQEIDCPRYWGCGKTFILKQCLIKHLDERDNF